MTDGEDIDVRTAGSALDGWVQSLGNARGHQSDMQWLGFGGRAREYRGPLFELGYGVPRNVPERGIRRALFDIAFGYVSGFPLRDIAYYVATRSFTESVLDAEVEEVTG